MMYCIYVVRLGNKSPAQLMAANVEERPESRVPHTRPANPLASARIVFLQHVQSSLGHMQHFAKRQCHRRLLIKQVDVAGQHVALAPNRTSTKYSACLQS